MQDRNHYDTLGLATTGVNPDTGKPYSDAEIRRAHKELSRDTHTDKTKLADARERFEKIQESYRLLIDPEQRAKFDKLLKDDPGLSSKPVHLFVRVDVEFNETADEKEDKTAEVKLSSSTELVVYKPKGIPKGINLTELLLNANYSAEQLLAQAKLNPGFATAILQAVSLWRLFSTEQQLEFFIYFYSSQKREAKADLTSIKINKPIHSLLLALENNDTVQKYFVTLVGKKEHAKIALDFLVDAKSYILSFNKYTLLSLALSFEIIIPYLLEKYNAELSVAELYALIMEHPAQKEKILSALSQERKSLMDDYLEADRAICERGISCTKYFAHHARALKNLGVEALKLVSISLEDFTIEKVIEKNKLGFLIINNLANKIEKGQLTPDEFNACAETITKRFLFYNYRLIVEDPSKLFEQEILRTLLEKFTDQYFIFLINNFKFEHWSYSSQLFLCRYFLTFRYEDSLVFLDRLQRHDHNVFQVLKNNPPLLSQFFATKEYTDALKGNPSLLKIFIKDVASPENTKQLTDLLIREKLCEPTVNKQLHAISKLHQYIQPEPSEEKTKKVSAREINYSKFAELYKESGFFPDLMRLNTKNSQVMMTLLRDGTHSPHMENDKFKSALETKLEFVLQNELPDEKAHAALFDTLSTSQLDNSVIKLLNESKEGPWKTVRFLSLNDRIRNKFITGRQLDALLAKESGQWLPVKYERLPEFSFKFASCRDKLQRIQFLKHLKESDFPYEQYATQDTTTHFSALVQLARSSWFVPMLMAYYELLELLDNIRHINSTELNNEETLTSLISVINKSGLDHATLSDIIRRLKYHPLLLAALFYLIDADILKSNEHQETAKLISATRNSLPRRAEKIEQHFLIIAKHYIEKNQHRIQGEVLLCLHQKFGERIDADIKKYQLDHILSNMKKTQTVMKQLNRRTQFDTADITEDQFFVEIEEKFFSLLNQPIDQVVNTKQEEAEALYSRLNELLKRYKHAALVELHAACPKDKAGNLPLWGVMAVLQGNEKYKARVNFILSDTNFPINAFHEICEHLLNELKNNAINIEQIENVFDGAISHRILKYFIDKHPDLVAPKLFDQLKTNKMTVAALLNFFSSNSLEEKYSVAVVNIPPVFTRMLILFLHGFEFNSADNRVDLLCQLISKSQLSLMSLIELSEENRQKLLKTLNYPEVKIYLRRLNRPLNIADLINLGDLFSKPDHLTQNTAFLDEKFRENILPVQASLLAELAKDESLHSLCRSYVLGDIHSDEVRNSLLDTIRRGVYTQPDNSIINFPLFFQSKYYQYIKEHVLDAIDSEISRLNRSRGSCWLRAGTDKASSLKKEKASIEKFLVSSLRQTTDKLIIHKNLISVIEVLAKDKCVNNRRNPAAAFFKGILGLLIALPCGLLPLLSNNYRAFFFSSATRQAFNRVSDALNESQRHMTKKQQDQMRTISKPPCPRQKS